MTENSVITRTRRVKLCLASSDATKPLAPITHIALGTGGADAGGEPIAPTDDMTALRSEVVRYPVGSVTYPVDTTARYAVMIPRDEQSGVPFSEAALVDSAGDIVAVKSFYPKRKDPGVAFTFEFDDEF